MKGAGKDSTALFNKFHAWVNIDGLLTKCLLGNLVDDDPSTTTITEEEDEEEEEKEEVKDDVDEKVEKVGCGVSTVTVTVDDKEQGKEDSSGRGTDTKSGNDRDRLLMPPPPLLSSSSVRGAIRINPGLQNVAAGGTVHNVRDTDTADTTTTSSSSPLSTPTTTTTTPSTTTNITTEKI
jgi:hypothetical protein